MSSFDKALKVWDGLKKLKKTSTINLDNKKFELRKPDQAKDSLLRCLGYLLVENRIMDGPYDDNATPRAVRNIVYQELMKSSNLQATNLATEKTLKKEFAIKCNDSSPGSISYCFQLLADSFNIPLNYCKQGSLKEGWKWKILETYHPEQKEDTNFQLYIANLPEGKKCYYHVLLQKTLTIEEITSRWAGLKTDYESEPVKVYLTEGQDSTIKVDLSRQTQTSNTVNTLNTQLRLPLIDVHCHLGCQNSVVTTGLGKTISRTVLKETGASKIGYFLYAGKNLANKLINSMQHFCQDARFTNHPGDVVGCVQMLDLHMCPLRIKKGPQAILTLEKTQNNKDNKRNKKTGNQNAVSEDLFYTCRGEKQSRAYAWFRHDTKNFEGLLDSALEACEDYPGQIWPFVGFDPRRKNAVDIIKEYLPNKGFVGIKLYSKTGWMPIRNDLIYPLKSVDDNTQILGDILDKRLEDLYTYVTENDIPMLVHASPGGYPPYGQTEVPWTFKSQRLTREDLQELKNDDKHFKFPWPPPYTKKELTSNDERTADPKKAIQGHATALANWCLYNQFTTSPYQWEKVLNKHRNLRLCFGHFGSAESMYVSPIRDIPVIERMEKELFNCPYAAGKEGSRSFRNLFKKEVIRRAYTEKKRFYHSKLYKNPEEFKKRLEDIVYGNGFFETDPQWSNWISQWEERYPLSWHEKMLEMLSDYPKLYADVAYLTTKKEEFSSIFGSLVHQALRNEQKSDTALQYKLIFGTDWFMTEGDSISPRDYWKMAWESFMKVEINNFLDHVNKKRLWELWTSRNAIRFVNLNQKNRMEGLVNFWGKMPLWWDDLKYYYENMDRFKEREKLFKNSKEAMESLKKKQNQETDQEPISDDKNELEDKTKYKESEKQWDNWLVGDLKKIPQITP